MKEYKLYREIIGELTYSFEINSYHNNLSITDNEFGIASLRLYPIKDKYQLITAITFFDIVNQIYYKELSKKIFDQLLITPIPAIECRSKYLPIYLKDLERERCIKMPRIVPSIEFFEYLIVLSSNGESIEDKIIRDSLYRIIDKYCIDNPDIFNTCSNNNTIRRESIYIFRNSQYISKYVDECGLINKYKSTLDYPLV